MPKILICHKICPGKFTVKPEGDNKIFEPTRTAMIRFQSTSLRNFENYDKLKTSKFHFFTQKIVFLLQFIPIFLFPQTLWLIQQTDFQNFKF
jgi:hypothetical protein